MKKSLSRTYMTSGILLCLLFGAVTGYGRLLVWFFLPGVQGMLMGGVLGFTLGGQLSRGEVVVTSFARRLRMAAGMALAFYAGQALVPAFVLKGWDPGFLPGAILSGHFREVMTGGSVYSQSVQQGPLTPGWWLFFQGLDSLFFMFLALIGTGIGLDKVRSRYRVWKPAVIVGGICALVLSTTLSYQSAHAGLLRDWQTRYGGGAVYSEWRDVWATAALRESAVRAFLDDTESVDLDVMPQLGVLRALGWARLGQFELAQKTLIASAEAARTYPGAIRLSRMKTVRARAFIEHVEQLGGWVSRLRDEGLSPAEIVSRASPDTMEWFPYESMLRPAS